VPHYAAFLRGVSPLNLKMPALKLALEQAGFSDVKTVLSSGNVVFSTRRAAHGAIERRVEAALEAHVGKRFAAIVRSIESLQRLLEVDPFRSFRLPVGAKCVVTLLRVSPQSPLTLPIEQDGARLLKLSGLELFSAYVPSDKGPVFMTLIEKACGKDVTTRTWDTLRKVVRAGTSSGTR